jgi:hypothetical protein
VGCREGSVDRRAVTFLEAESEIAGRLPPDGWRALHQRRGGIDRGRQFAVIDRDRLGGIARRLGAVRHNEGHRVAHMAHAPIGERRTRRHHERRHGRDLHFAGQRPDAVRLQIGDRVDARDTRHGGGRGGVDRRDARMRERRAQHVAVELAGLAQVVDVAALPDEEATILEPPARAADFGFGCRRARLRSAGHRHRSALPGRGCFRGIGPLG